MLAPQSSASSSSARYSAAQRFGLKHLWSRFQLIVCCSFGLILAELLVGDASQIQECMRLTFEGVGKANVDAARGDWPLRNWMVTTRQPSRVNPTIPGDSRRLCDLRLREVCLYQFKSKRRLDSLGGPSAPNRQKQATIPARHCQPYFTTFNFMCHKGISRDLATLGLQSYVFPGTVTPIFKSWPRHFHKSLRIFLDALDRNRDVDFGSESGTGFMIP